MGTHAQGDFFILLRVESLFVKAFDFCVAIIEEQNLVVGLALGAHNGSAYLTHTYTMTPTFAVEDELITLFLYLEG